MKMFPPDMNIQPGPSSQTTSVKVENLIAENNINLVFFDVYSPSIQNLTQKSWEEATEEVLQEYGELWERLSKL
jgi:hypothetical protein